MMRCGRSLALKRVIILGMTLSGVSVFPNKIAGVVVNEPDFFKVWSKFQGRCCRRLAHGHGWPQKLGDGNPEFEKIGRICGVFVV